MLPLRDENPVRRPPIVTWLIFAACVAVYLAWQPSPFEETSEDTIFYLENAAIPCEVTQGRPLDVAEVQPTFVDGDAQACGASVEGGSAPFDAGKNVWLSVITSIFLHGSLVHIGGNLLFLWVFANNVEDVLGRLGFVVFYLVGGVVATLTHVALDVDSTVPTVGASGAIAAVMGAYLVLFPFARVRTLIIMLLFVVIDVPAVFLLVFWFVLQFFTDPNDSVAWAAHVGGFVFGVLVGVVVRATGLLDRATGLTLTRR